MHKSDIRGQISVMISVMMATFILFFAFVINTGMLVNAKINLQNAADLAAYAGASVQARQLTNISYLNYEMRRQWKKFLYRIYVLGNHGYQSFPFNGGNGPMNYQPNPSAANLGVPTTCVFFDVNHCQVSVLPAIRIPPANFMDPITDALRGQLLAIESIRQDNCSQSGLTNMLLNTYWLYNTDPDLSTLASTAGGLTGTQAASLRLVTSQAAGLGIVPKEILLKMRILTLQKYVNTPAQLGITRSKISEFMASNITAPARERSISAFNSAYYTLGNFTFNSGSIVLDELLPTQILALKPIKTPFDTYAIDFEIDRTPGGDSACKPAVYNIGVKTPLTLGFSKDPKFLTYYAIRLKAQAQILFSPFGPLDLQAYAVAQPFGSRIGPNEDEVRFFFEAGKGGVGGGRIPSVSVLEGDSIPTVSAGWNTQTIISILAQASGIRAPSIPSVIDPNIGHKLAMTPNPWETRRYNIMNDIGQDAFMRNFENGGPASIWAPLSANGQSSAELKQEIIDQINGIDTPSQVKMGGAANGNFKGDSVKNALQSGLMTYIGTLEAGEGQTKEGFKEGFNVVKISNPYSLPPTSGVGSVFTMDQSKIKSSWNQVKDPIYQDQGRVGYSVKFVSFSSIEKNPTSSFDGNAAINGPTSIGDAGFDEQVFFIKH